jgi:hypothetical protein
MDISDFDLRDELNRKAITELQRVMHGLSVRTVGLDAAASSLHTLWQTLSGLIDPEVMDLVAKSLSAVRAKLEEKQRPDSLAFLIGAPGGCITARRDGGKVLVQMWVDTHKTERVFSAPDSEVHPELWAANKFNDIVQKFKHEGFHLAIQQ